MSVSIFLQIVNLLVLLLVGGGLWALWQRLQRLSRLAADGGGQEALVTAFQEEGRRLEHVFRDESKAIRTEAEDRGRRLREEVGNRIQTFGDSVQTHIGSLARDNSERLDRFGQSQEQRFQTFTETLLRAVAEKTEAMTNKVGELSDSNERRQEVLRKTVEERLDKLREENSRKIEEMQRTVDEKLEGTLEKRLGESFKLVGERLEQVHKGLGEMQNLAVGVGDLKRTLMNVKARGIWAEIQLETLLDEILTPEQYVKNARVNPESREVVEFAIRLPGRDEEDSKVLLPIDAKFPQEDFERLMDALDGTDKQAIEAAQKALENRIKDEAKSISAKYIKPPHTTDFAILFLPTEGLFTEVVRRPGLLETLQQKYHVTIAGPTTLSAFLNSLRMGFRTLAIQKRSSEVWKVLGKAKDEFKKYGDTWSKVYKQLQTVSSTVEQVGVRTRAVERSLNDVVSLERPQQPQQLEQSALAERKWQE